MASKKGTFLVLIGIPSWARTRLEMRSRPWGFTMAEARRQMRQMVSDGWRSVRIVDVLKAGSLPNSKEKRK